MHRLNEIRMAYITTNDCQLCKKNCLLPCALISHDDVIKWKHFPRYWPYITVTLFTRLSNQWQRRADVIVLCLSGTLGLVIPGCNTIWSTYSSSWCCPMPNILPQTCLGHVSHQLMEYNNIIWHHSIWSEFCPVCRAVGYNRFST